MEPPQPRRRVKASPDVIMRHMSLIYRYTSELMESEAVTQHLHARLKKLHHQIERMHGRETVLVLGEFTTLLGTVEAQLKRRATKHPIRRLLTNKDWQAQMEALHRDIDRLVDKAKVRGTHLPSGSDHSSSSSSSSHDQQQPLPPLRGRRRPGDVVPYERYSSLDSQAWPQELEHKLRQDDDNVARMLHQSPTWLKTSFDDSETRVAVLYELQYALSTRVSARMYSKTQQRTLRMVYDYIVASLPRGLADMPQARRWFVPSYVVRFSIKSGVRGAYGTTHRGVFLEERPVVVKCLWVKELGREVLMKWLDPFVTRWMQLAHPHITSVVGACHLHKPPFLVREQVRHGDIITYLSNIPDAATRTQRRWELLVQAVQGLQYLHKHDVVHGNLKCSNVLVSRSEQAKLADFGTCFLMQDAVTKLKQVHQVSKDEVQWRAPECCSQSSDVTKAADVYALGMCIIEVVTGAKPWGAVSSSVVMSDKQRGALPERPATMSLIAWELVERMCMHDPVQRMGLEEVEQVLQQLATGVGAVVAQDAAADAAAAAAAAPSQPDQATQEDAQPEPEAREEEESHAPRSVYHSTQTGAKGSVPIVHMPSPKKEERETPASPPQEAGKKHEPVEESSEDAEDDEPEQHEQQAEEDGASDTDSDQQDANSGVQALLSRRPGPPSRRNFPLIAERVSHIVSNIWTTRYQSMAVEVASEDVLADNSLIEDAEREEAERKDPTSVPNLLIALMEDNVSQDHALAALSELNRKSEIHSDYESATVEVLLHLIETCMAMREQSLAATVLLRLAASSDTAKELIWEQHGIEVMEECVAMDHDMLSEMKSCIAKGKHAEAVRLINNSKFEDAIQVLTDAIMLDKKRWELFADRSRALTGCGMFVEAAKDAVRCTKLHPYGPRCEVGYIHHAIALRGLDQLDQAISVLRRALQVTMDGHPAIQKELNATEKLRSAKRDSDKLIQNAKRLGLTLAQYHERDGEKAFEKKHYSEAIKHFSQAIDTAAQSSSKDREADAKVAVRCLLYRAKCHEVQRKFDRVIDDCTQVLIIEPTEIFAIMRRAHAYEQLGDTKHAVSDYHKAVAINPEYKKAKDRLDQLEQLC